MSYFIQYSSIFVNIGPDDVLVPPNTKILRTILYFRGKNEIDNQSYIYSRICADGSSIIEGADFNVPYAPVAGIRSLCVIIEIAYAEGLIVFVLDIYNDFHNTILLNPTEIVYLSLPYMNLD